MISIETGITFILFIYFWAWGIFCYFERIQWCLRDFFVWYWVMCFLYSLEQNSQGSSVIIKSRFPSLGLRNKSLTQLNLYRTKPIATPTRNKNSSFDIPVSACTIDVPKALHLITRVDPNIQQLLTPPNMCK